MAREYYAVGAPVAAALSVLPVANLLLWIWLLVAAEIAVCLMLVQEWRSSTSAVAVANDNEQPRSADRRLVTEERSRRPFRYPRQSWCGLPLRRRPGQRLAAPRRWVSS
jgi:hypothetical protein